MKKIDNFYTKVIKYFYLQKKIFKWNNFLQISKKKEYDIVIEGDLSALELENLNLGGTIIDNVDFSGADLTNANFNAAIIKKSDFTNAILNGVMFDHTTFNDVDFTNAIFNKNTIFSNCKISKKSNFRTKSFEKAQFSPGLKQTCEYCNRKNGWEEWYPRQNFIVAKTTNFFWWISDYGRSTISILLKFLIFSLIFSIIYFALAVIYYNEPDKEIIHGLIQYPTELNSSNIIEPTQSPEILNIFSSVKLFCRSFYFSIVTMTTLGFGDICAGYNSLLGHLLLIFHVIIGYIILAALITRLGVMFTSDGPAVELIEEEMAKQSLKYRIFDTMTKTKFTIILITIMCFTIFVTYFIKYIL